MTKLSLWVPVFSVLAATVAGSVTAQTASETKNTFQTLYDSSDKGLQNKDVEAALTIYSPDYVETNQKGAVVTYYLLRETLEKMVDRYKSLTYKVVVQSANVTKTGVIVVARQHGIVIRNDESTGQKVVIVSEEEDRDFWIKTDDGWKIKQERVLSHHATRNGVPVK